uniref:Uncharacterized protein n=1 Tax=Meloidogyne enterolobii TaxID=390850 RepID=A0A6V7UER6_MELEN|nr:unnamed protein product [Meloidogyne enterolobii]
MAKTNQFYFLVFSCIIYFGKALQVSKHYLYKLHPTWLLFIENMLDGLIGQGKFFLNGSSSSSYSLNYDEKRERREQQQLHDETNFAEWLPGHVQSEGGLFLLDRRALFEGEVLLFRTKKSRHRAIPVMSSQKQQQNFGNSQEKIISTTSRFSDALTFKDWLRRVYHNGDKGFF